jgi:hypothetical protein
MQNDLSQFLASLVVANLAYVLQVNVPEVAQQPAKQQPAPQAASLTREERNRLVLSLLDGVTPIIRRYAAAYRLDFEETYQDMSIVIMRLLDAGIDGIHNLPAYVTLRVKSRIINKLRDTDHVRRRESISLDAPVSQDEDSFTLADLLPSSFASMQPEEALIAKEDIEEAFLWLPDFQSPNTRRALRLLGETAAASLVGGAK